MIFFKRRRLLIWLVRAYLRKWRRNILIFFSVGLAIFFILALFIKFFNPILPFVKREIIGVSGSYSADNLPIEVLSNVSYGLTYVSPDGEPKPMAASEWTVKDDGKTYVFRLRKDLFFSDGKPLTSNLVNYDFSNVSVERPDTSTIIFKLKESYSPFLITVSRPIIKKNYVGLSDYKVKKIDINAGFVESIQLFSRKEGLPPIIYQFYPTEDAVKKALVLGEITKTQDLSGLSFKDTSFDKFKNLTITKRINYAKLVTLFYNTQDKVLSDKRLREALSYTIPNEFEEGKRNRTPYPPAFWVSQENASSIEQDFNHAKLLFSQSQASSSGSLTLNLKTLPKYKKVAEGIKSDFKKIGINTNIEVTDTVPSGFQIFLGDYNVSNDPDQYPLWHSGQPNNITGYRNLRIDKLLEDGRQTIDSDSRKRIYSDFQKYLLDDSPATFLYFPNYYTVTRN